MTATAVQRETGSTPSQVQRTSGTGDVSFAGPSIELETVADPPISPDPPVTRILRIDNTVYVTSLSRGTLWARSSVLAKNLSYLGALTPSSWQARTGP